MKHAADFSFGAIMWPASIRLNDITCALQPARCSWAIRNSNRLTQISSCNSLALLNKLASRLLRALEKFHQHTTNTFDCLANYSQSYQNLNFYCFTVIDFNAEVHRRKLPYDNIFKFQISLKWSQVFALHFNLKKRTLSSLNFK